MPSFYLDDNGEPLVDPQGMRPQFGTSGIVSVTMSGSTQELTLPVPTGSQTATQKSRLYQIVGSQPILFALDATGQGGSYTGLTNMVYVPAAWVYWFRARPTDVSIYVLQGGTAGTFQCSVMGD